MNRDFKLFIDDILENIELIENSTCKLSKIQFESDRNIIDATIRRLEVIGEAVKNLPELLINKYSNIPWEEIAGTRDKIIHHYFGIDLDIIWDIIKINIPDLKIKIQKIREIEIKKKNFA
ncbi:MAG: DUF86 domain-containing protein [Nanoarchaeota archaeon]|nr:DUF86 domain-containing protein [Nanoarchaeota archaeon]